MFLVLLFSWERLLRCAGVVLLCLHGLVGYTQDDSEGILNVLRQASQLKRLLSLAATVQCLAVSSGTGML